MVQVTGPQQINVEGEEYPYSNAGNQPLAKLVRNLLIASNNWNIETKRYVGSPLNSLQGAGVLTYHTAGTVEQEFDWVRMVVLNNETGVPAVGCLANFAPTSTLATATINTPSGGNSSWTNFTWSGAGTFDMPTTGASASAYATPLASDWMPIQSIPRTDNPVVNIPAFMWRVELPANAGTTRYTRDVSQGGNGTEFNTDAGTNYRTWTRIGQGVAGVTTPANFTFGIANQGNTSISAFLQFRTRGQNISWMACGDSIAAGARSTSWTTGYNQWAPTLVSNRKFPIDVCNAGWIGQTTTQYLANAKTLITAIQPHIASYPVYSPNDASFGMSVADQQIQRAMDFVAHCRANNTLPILITPTPRNDNSADTALQSTAKQYITDTLKGLASKGVLVVDFWSNVTDFTRRTATGGFPWLPNLSDDFLHPNQLCHQGILSNLWVAQLKALVMANSN